MCNILLGRAFLPGEKPYDRCSNGNVTFLLWCSYTIPSHLPRDLPALSQVSWNLVRRSLRFIWHSLLGKSMCMFVPQILQPIETCDLNDAASWLALNFLHTSCYNSIMLCNHLDPNVECCIVNEWHNKPLFSCGRKQEMIINKYAYYYIHRSCYN